MRPTWTVAAAGLALLAGGALSSCGTPAAGTGTRAVDARQARAILRRDLHRVEVEVARHLTKAADQALAVLVADVQSFDAQGTLSESATEAILDAASMVRSELRLLDPTGHKSESSTTSVSPLTTLAGTVGTSAAPTTSPRPRHSDPRPPRHHGKRHHGSHHGGGDGGDGH